jgi:hypothetical protein
MSAPVTGSVMVMGETEKHGRSDRDFSGTWVPQTQQTIGGYSERHGRVSSWVLVAVVVVAFCVGGAAIIVRLWWLFWVCVGIVVLAVPAGKIVRIMDDTVLAAGELRWVTMLPGA